MSKTLYCKRTKEDTFPQEKLIKRYELELCAIKIMSFLK